VDVEELLIRESVRQTYTDYSTAGDAGRLDDFVLVFAEDAILEIPPDQSAQGRDAIHTMLTAGSRHQPPVAFAGQKAILRHFTTNIHFRSVAADRVETTAYFCAVTAVGPDHWGRYFDVLVPREGRWLFEHRIAKVEGFQADGWYQRNLPDPTSVGPAAG
jgi:hypothetical protein